MIKFKLLGKKNKIVSAIVLLFAVIFNCNMIAQPKYSKGYVIMLNNDTLRGEIKTNAKREFDNFIKIAYRKSEGNEIKTFLPKKTKGYMVDSITFISTKIDEELMFVKRLSCDTAATKIYEAQIQYEAMNDTKVSSDYYIEKENKELVKIKSKKANKLIDEAKAKNKRIEVAELGLKE